jgi:hypothetical protein
MKNEKLHYFTTKTLIERETVVDNVMNNDAMENKNKTKEHFFFLGKGKIYRII